MAKAESLTEQLKAEAQITWARMNNMRSRTTELVRAKIIYQQSYSKNHRDGAEMPLLGDYVISC